MNKCRKIIIQILIIAMFFIYTPKTLYASNTTFKIGDINGDGAIDSRDTLRILEHIAASNIPKIKQNHSDWILTADKLKAADINGDGIIDSRDTLRELEYIAASTIPTIAKKHTDWKTYIEKKWVVDVTGIKLDKTTLNIEKGKTSKLVATITPTNASNKVVTWTSSNTKVATVDGLGNITAKAAGITVITSKSTNGKTATCKVAVNNPVIVANSISLNKTSLILNKGASGTLFATITPSNTTNKTVTWSSSNTNIVSVANGKITAKAAGTATITVKTSNGKTATCRVTVNNPVVVATRVTLNHTSLSLDKGASGTLFATITPSNTTNKTITWSSSNANIVSVVNGKITAKSAGTATITVKTSNGKTATCKVAVITQIYPENDKISVKGKKITKGQYANFRNVCAGKIGKNVLYRCIDPILPYSSKQKEPAYYADQLLKAHNVNVVLNISDSMGKIKSKGYSKATYYKRLLNAGKVYLYAFKDNGSYGKTNVKKTIVNGLRTFIKNKGPYAVHCKWGQGRTGFVIMLLECLMDAPYDYIYNDFVVSFKNLNHSGANKEFSKTIKIITGKSAKDKNHPKASDWKNINFVKCAENYLRSGGMSDSEIKALKDNLSKNY